MFLGLFQKDLCKGRRMEFEAAFFQTKLLSRKVFRLPRPAVLLRKFANTKMAATVKNLTFTDEELPLHVLVGYKQKMKAKALIGTLSKQSGRSSTKSLSKSLLKTFRGECVNNSNNNILTYIELFL